MSDHTKNWPELAIGLYDALTGRGAQINYKFDDMHVSIPSGVGSDAEHAEWKINGGLAITTSEASAPN